MLNGKETLQHLIAAGADLSQALVCQDQLSEKAAAKHIACDGLIFSQLAQYIQHDILSGFTLEQRDVLKQMKECSDEQIVEEAVRYIEGNYKKNVQILCEIFQMVLPQYPADYVLKDKIFQQAMTDAPIFLCPELTNIIIQNGILDKIVSASSDRLGVNFYRNIVNNILSAANGSIISRKLYQNARITSSACMPHVSSITDDQLIYRIGEIIASKGMEVLTQCHCANIPIYLPAYYSSDNSVQKTTYEQWIDKQQLKEQFKAVNNKKEYYRNYEALYNKYLQQIITLPQHIMAARANDSLDSPDMMQGFEI